jgi:hypothetical protein
MEWSPVGKNLQASSKTGKPTSTIKTTTTTVSFFTISQIGNNSFIILYIAPNHDYYCEDDHEDGNNQH